MTDPPPLTARLCGVADFLEQVDLVTARLLAGGANHLRKQGGWKKRGIKMLKRHVYVCLKVTRTYWEPLSKIFIALL